jgi:hypothetical protein
VNRNDEFLELVGRAYGWAMCIALIVAAIWIAAGMPE